MALTSTPEAEKVHLASELRIAVMRLGRRLRNERVDETLTLTQISALAALSKRGPLSPSALAEFERVQPPSMTRVIAALEARGLVERAAHPSDGRVSVIAVTAEGKGLLEEDRRRTNAWLGRVLETVTEEERAILEAAAPIIDRLSGF